MADASTSHSGSHSSVAPALRLPAEAGAQDELPCGQVGVQPESHFDADGGADGRGRLDPGLRRDDGEGGDDGVLRDDASPGSTSPQDQRVCDKMPPPTPPVRHDGWTREKMASFLRELAASQSVSQAATSVGMARQSAYRLRNRLAGTPFALAWEVALEAGLQQLAHAVMDRAVNGEEVPHYYHGELVGTHRKFDNRLAVWLLANPWKVGRQQVAREYTAEGWDKLLERVEWAGFDWEEGEVLPGADPWPPRNPKDAAEAEQAFIGKRSWYMAEAADEQMRERGFRR